MNLPSSSSSCYNIDLLPYYRISKQLVPREGTASEVLVPTPMVTTINIVAGKGFGDGRHETTQLCLLAMGYLLRSCVRPKKVLDFGAGNGVLGIAAAITGAFVEAVEIDDGALAEARNNATLNGVSSQFDFRAKMREPAETYELVVANILRGVLLEYACALTSRVSTVGYLVLSGLLSTDVPVLLAEYRPRLPMHRAQVYERGQWRAVLFVPSKETGDAARVAASSKNSLNDVSE